MKIVPLAKNHRRELFACGVPSLDQYLQKQASQDERRRLSKCYILEDDHQNVCGYFTLSMASIPAHELPEAQRKKLPNYPAFPVVLLGRLARDQKLRGQHWGTTLMADALWRSWMASTTIAAYAVVVDPLDAQAQQFYQRFGFETLLESDRMFLPMKTIELGVERSGEPA
jgi:predicted GNAT family N-acyltransferase